MFLVGAAAAAPDLYAGQHLLQLPVQLAKLERVAAVQHGRAVQLGVALGGGVALQLTDSRHPALGCGVSVWVGRK